MKYEYIVFNYQYLIVDLPFWNYVKFIWQLIEYICLLSFKIFVWRGSRFMPWMVNPTGKDVIW